MERLMEELSFDAPKLSGQAHEVDATEVDRRLAELAHNEDLAVLFCNSRSRQRQKALENEVFDDAGWQFVNMRQA